MNGHYGIKMYAEGYKAALKAIGAKYPDIKTDMERISKSVTIPLENPDIGKAQ